MLSGVLTMLRRIGYYGWDEIRFSRNFRGLVSRVIELRAAMMDSGSGRRLAALAAAARGCYGLRRRRRLDQRLRSEIPRVNVQATDWGAIFPGRSDGSTIQKAIILKPPVSASEKGVLYVTFENQWVKLLRSGRIAAIADRYDLVLGPSWSPPPDPAMLMVAKMWPGGFYTLLSNFEDAGAIRNLADNIEPVPLLASSWTNPSLYDNCISQKKEFDMVMVASFGTYKRHWHFFDVLRRMPSHIKVLLVGCTDGNRTAKTLQSEARDFGVQNRFELWVGAKPEEIPSVLCRSRVSLIFSRQEGACVAVAESLMAGTPVGVLRDAHIGSKAFINAQTGVLLDRSRDLPRQILRFLDTHGDYRPRPWAIENISCHVSSRTLNNAIRDGAVRQGRPWTRNIAVIYQNNIPRYVDPSEGVALEGAYDEFRERFGLEIVRPLPSGASPAPVTT